MAFSSLKKIVVLAAVAVATATAVTPDAPYYNQEGILQIGTQEALNITVASGISRDDTVSYPDASYIAVHFSNFDLPEGDLVVVRSPDSSVAHFYTGKGRDQEGDFIASFVPGSTAIVQYFSATVGAAASAPGYTISGFSRGFSDKKTSESICGVDNTVPAKCFQSGSTLYSTLPSAYTKGRAVARLLIGGSSLCTGWLIGSEGHLITNQHCITAAADAKSVDFEFGAESASCATQCQTQLGCPGTVVATTSTFITNSDTYDYAIVKLPSSAAISSYGYLQLRAAGPTKGERIYIPQHPSGWAKRVAYIVDGGASATITSLGGVTSCGSNEVGYNADTAGGASGSPVLSATDNKVVALHHCGGCANTAINVLDIIKDLKAKAITIANISA
ncbi:hypothetical protein FI667_g11857, partial [Globisporangium splendens]